MSADGIALVDIPAKSSFLSSDPWAIIYYLPVKYNAQKILENYSPSKFKAAQKIKDLSSAKLYPSEK